MSGKYIKKNQNGLTLEECLRKLAYLPLQKSYESFIKDK
jgi:hypothetical protein